MSSSRTIISATVDVTATMIARAIRAATTEADQMVASIADVHDLLVIRATIEPWIVQVEAWDRDVVASQVRFVIR